MPSFLTPGSWQLLCRWSPACRNPPHVSAEPSGTAGKGGCLSSGGASLMHTSCFAIGKGKEKIWLKEGLVYSLLWKCSSWPSESY